VKAPHVEVVDHLLDQVADVLGDRDGMALLSRRLAVGDGRLSALLRHRAAASMKGGPGKGRDDACLDLGQGRPRGASMKGGPGKGRDKLERECAELRAEASMKGGPGKGRDVLCACGGDVDGMPQ